MDAEEIEKSLGLKIEGKTEEGHSHTTFYGVYEGEEVIVKHSEDEKVLRELEALKLVKDTGIPTPEVLDYQERDGDHILVTKKVESSFPNRDLWKDYEFCMSFTESAAEVLNLMHSSRLDSKAREKDHLPQNTDRAAENIRSKIPKIRKTLEDDVLEVSKSIVESLSSDHGFTHADFTTENILINDGDIAAVVDWAESGFTSQIRDIALFEASFIDEYIRFFHPQKVEEIRETFRSKLNYDSSEKLELYRFHQNAVSLAYIKQGQCSQEWKKVGTVEEIERHREKILQEDLDQVREILKEM